MRSLIGVLGTDYGLAAPLVGWHLSTATDITPDGRHIVGIAHNPQGQLEPWIAFLGTPTGPTWNLDANGNWSTVDNWTANVPNSLGALAVLADTITAPRTITLDTPITVGRLHFENSNPYTVAGSNTLTLDNTSGYATLNVESGSHTISAPVTLADDTLITVMPAASTLSITGALNASGKTLTKAGAGTLALNNIRASGLSINSGTVSVRPNAGASELGTSVVSTLSIAGGATPTAKLDLTNNAAIINYSGTSPVATVRQQILAGRGSAGLGATWTGQGVTSSTTAAANAAEPESRALGYAENASLPLGPYTTFRGQPVDETSLLIAYTRTGDANLDGIVNDDDVTIVSATYAPGVLQPHWALGDFDYNGFVDDDDVTLLGAFYDPTAQPVISAAPARDVTAVPEPSTWALLIGGLIVILMFALHRRFLLSRSERAT